MTTEPQAKPLPTLQELADHHRISAKADCAEAPKYPGIEGEFYRMRTAWHEAAARQIEAMAAAGRIRVNVLRNIAQNSAGELGKLSHDQLVWKLDTIHRLVVAALAAPPAEEPRPSLIEVRRNTDGSLDEIVAHGAFVHLEQMDNCAWFLAVEKDGRKVKAWLRSTRKVSTYVEVDGRDATVEPAEEPR